MAKDLNNILLSQEEENKIKAKTPDKLPLNPTAQGWSGQEVRRFLAKSLTDNEGSFLAEFKKKMIEIKTQFEDVFGEGDGKIQDQIDSIVQDIEAVESSISSLETTILNNYNTLDNIKVNKTLTILGIDLQDDITLSEFKIALGDATTFTNGLMSALDKENLEQTIIDIQNLFSNKADKTDIPTNVSQLNNDSGYITDYTETDPIFTAWNKSTGISITKSQVSDLIEATQALSGLMSATDKQRLDVLHALLEEDTENNVVDSINEVLAIFNNYPEGADLVTALAGKVDKVSGKGLSTNDLTNTLKSNYDTAYGWGNHAVEGYLKSITKAMVEAVLTGTINTHNHNGTYEPAFTKNTAFNKNFGTSAGTVAEGNHFHNQYLTFANIIDMARYKGTYEQNGDYQKGDIVKDGNNTFYMCVENVLSGTPLPTEPNFYKLGGGGGSATLNFRGGFESGASYSAGDIVYSVGNDGGFLYLFTNDVANKQSLPELFDAYCIKIDQKAERLKVEQITSFDNKTTGTLLGVNYLFTNYGNNVLTQEFYPHTMPDLKWVKENNKFVIYDSRGKLAALTDIPTKTSELVNDSGLATESYVDNKVASIYKYKGSVSTYNNLPTTNRNVGDVYDVQDTGMNYAWNGSDWDSLGIVIDLSNYYQKNETFTQNEINSMLGGKQDKLVAGENITIDENTNVISASGGEVDLNTMIYFNYASNIYGDKYSLFLNAWGSSLAVDPSEISEDSSHESQRGTAQYPNGETEGVIIPHGVTTIGDFAFKDWETNNQPLVIPDSVTSIGFYAFFGWLSNNHPLVIPNSVTSIDFGAFELWLANNQPLVIPNSVTSIGERAFNRWNLVPYVEIQATTPPTLVNANAFGYQGNAPIYVPDDSVEAYKTAANWVELANRIFPISDKPDLMDDIEAVEQQIADLQENKLNKIWTDITEQTTINLTDVLVFNRGSNVYRTTIANLLAKVDNEIFEVVSVLPTTGVVNKIYLVPSSEPQTQNALDEYIWVDSAWEKIGAVSVDLSNYFNKTEINSLLGGKQDKLVAGYNISINPNTNVISASGGGIDLNMLGYMNYAADIFYRGRRQSLFLNAWGSSLAVDPLEISANSSSSSPRGTAQYPNGETEGVIIPQGVTTIGEYAFSNWQTNNQPLVLPNSVTSIGNNAFQGWGSNNQPLVIPDSVISIGYRNFYSWTSNNQPLVIPSSVTSIGHGAFRSWSSNNHPLIIPSTVTSIGSGAFGYWQSNTHPITIPNSVTSIADSAFIGWSLVPYIEIQATTPPTLAGSGAFANQNDAPIYVPDESVDDYKEATNWIDLADRIFSINDKSGVIGDIESALDAILGV